MDGMSAVFDELGVPKVKYFRTYDFDDNVSSNLRKSKLSGFGHAKTFDLDEACELISSGTYSRGNSKRKRDSSSDQNTQRDKGPSGLKPKLKIVCTQEPLRSHGMSNVQESKLNCGKAIFSPPDGAENIMDVLDSDPSLNECMVGESGDMNFKKKLAHIPLPLGKVSCKLNEASHRLDAESTRYNMLKAKLGQVDLIGVRNR
ncbi:hypothetical protein Cgig2_021446 [Carnegiea gigantea]|uniref:Uncharacterized protein n=1 Tax=Carnegiea gigantea TaxID=171969 RepID=A0A9Q1QB67_9CARY|nr:hypothetical protein Cgig2_021446 [Carnegiea gigantea]